MNFASILTAIIIATIFILIVVGEIKKRKNGKGGCSCGCDNCSLKGSCHQKEE